MEIQNNAIYGGAASLQSKPNPNPNGAHAYFVPSVNKSSEILHKRKNKNRIASSKAEPTAKKIDNLTHRVF